MRRAVLLLVMFATTATCLSLVACSSGGTVAASSPDPFVGTWRQLDYKSADSMPLVIGQAPQGYRAILVTTVADNAFRLTRRGRRLSGVIGTEGGPLAVELTYLPASGRLVWRNGRRPGGAVAGRGTELMRVSLSTPPPSGP